MSAVVAVIDTNVLVAGLLTNAPDSPVCRIVDGMLAGQFPFLLSPELVKEYRQVLLRSRIQKLHGLTAPEVDTVLAQMTANGLWRDIGHVSPAPDPGDTHLWALLAAHKGAILVTGDHKLLENPPKFASVSTYGGEPSCAIHAGYRSPPPARSMKPGNGRWNGPPKSSPL